MSLGQILIIAFGILAMIDIHLLRQIKWLNKGFTLLVNQSQNHTAMLFYLKNKLNISEEEYQNAIREFDEMVENYEDL